MARPIGSPVVYWRGKKAWLRWTEPGKGQQRKPLGDVSQEELSTPFFCQYIFTYLNWHAAEYPAHHPRVESIVRVHLAPAFGNLPLDKISAELVERYKQQRRAKPGTVAKELRTLNAILSHAVTWDVLIGNPIKGKVKPPKDPKSNPRHYYTVEQLQKLYALNTHWSNVWKFMANTGLRLHEMQNLQHCDIREEAIYVVSTPDSPNKTTSWRLVPLSNNAQEALKCLTSSVTICPMVTGKSMSRAFKREARRAEIPGSLHWLRHTYCSHLVMGGVALEKVQKLAGHSTFKTTLHYVHLAPGYLQTGVVNI